MRRRKSRLPGIVDVAAAAGVSPATVSRYFNSPDMVRLRTRSLIRRAVDDLGYVRNRAMQSMIGGATGSVGLVIPTIDNAIFSEMLQAFSSCLAARDRTLLIAAHSYDLDQEVLLVQSLLEQRIDALALVGLEHRPETLRLIDRLGMPTVFLWTFRDDQPWPCIGFDNEEAGRIAARHLIDLGHHDILLVTGDETSNDRAAGRRKGALEAFRRVNITIPTGRQIISPYDIQASKDSILNIVKSKDRPTALLAGNDVIAQGALFAACTGGLSVPWDLSIIGIGDFRGSSAVEPGLTTVRIPARQVGELAADALVKMIHEPDADAVHQHRFPLELVVRGTTRPIEA